MYKSVLALIIITFLVNQFTLLTAYAYAGPNPDKSVSDSFTKDPEKINKLIEFYNTDTIDSATGIPNQLLVKVARQ